MTLSKHKLVEKTLQKNHSCYVLITCDQNEEGYNVEMSYNTDDPVLASMLLHGAQSVIDEDTEDSL
jgi:hypothetical protein